MRFEEHLVLHGLAIKKHATPDQVAETIDVGVDVVTRILQANVSTGRVVEFGDKYTLTPGARMILRGEYSRHYSALRSSEAFAEAYDRFEKVNEDVKTLITAWQVRQLPSGEAVSNDHSDADYDAKIIDRLATVHERFEPTLKAMGKEAPRLERYAEKLEAALDKADQGDHRWVSDVNLPSYHTVWFELHEDLLCILGKTRLE